MITAASSAAALRDPASFATPLVCALLGRLGAEALGWDAAAVRAELADEGVLPSPAQFDRMMAGVAVLATDRFRHSLPDFLAVAGALVGDGAGGHFDPPAAEDLAWALSEVRLLEHLVFGREEGPGDYAAEVRHYVGHSCRHEGLLDPPDVLKLGVLPDRDRLGRRAAAHSEDPGVYADVVGSQNARNSAIEAEVHARMRLLLTQLAALWVVSVDEATRVVAAR